MSEAAEQEQAPGAQSDTSEDEVKATLKRARGGSVLEVGTYAAGVAIRLGSNLVLTRLLFPEAFGLMAMVQSVIYVLFMLSDVGLSQSIIRSPNGDRPEFLNTAYTLQAIRGVGLYAAILVLTYPVALFLKTPDLLWLLPLSSASLVVHGFVSTRVSTLRKHLNLAPLMVLGLTSQVSGMLVTMAAAYMGMGVASLIVGTFTSAIVEVGGSRFLPADKDRDRFQIHKEYQDEILSFGRWIFMSSALTAFTQKGDQLLIARLLGAAGVGVYQIALAMAELPEVLAAKVISGAIYPTLAKVQNSHKEQFAQAYYHARLWLDPLAYIALGGLIGMSDWVIRLLYDDRYQGAASMLRILAIRNALAIMATLCETCFMARGESSFGFRRNVFLSGMLVVAMPVGHWLGGNEGLLWGTVVARFSGLMGLWPGARKRGFLWLRREVLVIPYLAIGWAVGSALASVLPNVR